MPAAVDHSADAPTFLSALRDQVDCYRRLKELAREQSRHVLAGDTEKLLDVLQRRQVWADSAQTLEGSLSEVKQAWPATAQTWEAGEREEAERLFAEAKALLEQITGRDAQDMLALQQRRQVVGQRIRQSETDTRTVRQINRRYAAAAYGRPASTMDVRK